MIHYKKILLPFFDDVKSGRKTFEIRYNDCDYQIGDYILLQEWDGDKYTGEKVLVQINYKSDLFGIGLKDNYIALGIIVRLNYI
ncbi:MAG: DUF3850 domain-containing protein [Candidatus Lokiarchaeota archaeon]|nr:DUF3850 domain-containing protein [Candidatus Lokiarchaeota archaeon]